jgi:tetratricopeptide (TPR) repeat protein
MDLKAFYKQRKEIDEAWKNGREQEALELARLLVDDLWEEKDYTHIVEVYDIPNLQPKESLYSFELAYSLVEKKRDIDAERIYEAILADEPENSSVLNNLHIIKKNKDQIEDAWKLIQRAKQISPKDEIIDRNFNNMKMLFEERKGILEQFKASSERVQKENDFVLEKLRIFVANALKDSTCKKNQIPIPKWKMRVLMGTDESKASSLTDQWIEKGYLRRTGDRGEHGEHIYEISPYLKAALESADRSRVPKTWSDGIRALDGEHLEQLGYFDTIQRVRKTKKAFRTILERDLNELFLNYLMGNHKAVVVMSGSLVETLLIYHCEKKKVSQVTYDRNQRQISKRLYDADLGDLLDYFEQNRMLSDLFVHMGNISRISRNFIHPGKELRETEHLSQAKADMCFISALEVARHIC